MTSPEERGRNRAVVIAASLVLTACGGGGGGGGAPPPAPPQNRAPTLGTAQFTTSEDVDLSAQVTASDPDGDALSFTRTSDPANGAVSAFNANGSFVYRPPADFSGSDSFSIRVADAQGSSITGTVSIQVTAVDDPTIASNDVMRADGPALQSLNVLGNDRNPDGESLTVTIEEPAAVGTASVNSDGTVRISALPAGFRGVTRFTYRVSESDGSFTVGTAAIFVGVDPFRVAFVGDDNGNGSPEIFMTDLANPPLRVTAATEGTLRMRGFLASQNGATIAYRRDETPALTLRDISFVRTADPSSQVRIQLPNGMRHITDVFLGEADQYVVSPDGQWIATVVAIEPPGTAAVIVLNVADPTTLHRATATNTTFARMLQFSANSRHVYFVASDGSDWRLYRTALAAPTQSTPLSAAASPTDTIDVYAVSADQSRVVFHARRAGVLNIYFVDPTNPGVEVRLNHELDATDRLMSSTAFPMRNTIGGSPDGSRIAYSVIRADDSVVTYVSEVGATPNPRTIGQSGPFTASLRPDNQAILYVESIGPLDQVYEALIDSAQPHTLVGEGFNPQFDTTGGAVFMQQVHYLDPQMTQLYLTIGASTRAGFGSAQQVGTPGLAALVTSFSGVDRGVAIVGEGAINAPGNATARLALVSAWAPDRLLYLAPFASPRNFRTGRAVVVSAQP